MSTQLLASGMAAVFVALLAAALFVGCIDRTRYRRRKPDTYEQNVARLAARRGAVKLRPDPQALRQCARCRQPVVPLSEPDDIRPWEAEPAIPHAAVLTCAPCVAELAVLST